MVYGQEWAKHRPKKRKRLSAVTGRHTGITPFLKKKERIPLYWIQRSQTGMSSRISSWERFAIRRLNVSFLIPLMSSSNQQKNMLNGDTIPTRDLRVTNRNQ